MKNKSCKCCLNNYTVKKIKLDDVGDDIPDSVSALF